jgi:WD40 repeat protein
MVATTVGSDRKQALPGAPHTTHVHGNPTRSATPTASPESQPWVATNQVRDPERYHILCEHGRGGLGRVSRAHDRSLGRDVAIKELISPGRIGELRFLREALITARLEHPGIVPIHEAGRWPDGTPFYAMKLVAGRPLRDLIAERKTVDQRIGLLHHVIAVADAIAYAHGRNIIHRDLKPANVIVGDFGETIVIDWGLAKDLSASEEATVGGDPFRAAQDHDLTAAGAVLGTPSYMAPEQERGGHVDQRADVFAIGAMLWELCSLQKVPPANVRLRHRLLRRAGIDRDLAVIIDKALDPDPQHRYSDAGGLAADLKAFKSGARISARSYSLLGTLAHWTRRRRSLALSVASVIMMGIVGVVLYIRDVAAERDRADAALADAREHAQRATIANATSLLERDPTQAWTTLNTLTERTPEITLLLARIRAAGVADVTLPLATRMDNVALTPSGTHLLVSTFDRVLLDIDLQTSAIRRLADGLTEPSIFATTDSDAYVLRNAARLTLSRISLTSGKHEDLLELAQLPVSLVVSDAGVFWQYITGAVQQLLPNHTSRTVIEKASQSFVVGSNVVICDNTHILKIGKPDHALKAIGRCSDTWGLVDNNNKFIIPVDEQFIGLYQAGKFDYLNIDRGAVALGFSETGLISVVDSSGNGTFRLPNADAFRRVHLGKRAVGTHALGSFAVWSFEDGSIKIVDTATGREWSIKAHSRGLFCAYLLPPGNRIVTCGRNEIRTWILSDEAPTPAAELPARAFNVAFNDVGTALFDGGNGDVYALHKGATSATFLHKHELLSFGVGWCDGQACSAGWDGRVLCSSSDLSSVATVATFETSTRWLGGHGGHCFIAVSNGAIYDARSPGSPLYHHDHEPYRVALSPDGSRLASTDWGGTIKVWDLQARSLVANVDGMHAGLVVNAIWINDNQLVAAGYDGLVHLLDRNFKVKRSWSLRAPVRYIAAANETIYAALVDGTVWSISTTGGSKRLFSLGATLTAFSVSPDGAAVAAGTDDGELFIINENQAVSVYRFRQGMIRCAAFEDNRTLLACVPENRVMRITPSI